MSQNIKRIAFEGFKADLSKINKSPIKNKDSHFKVDIIR
jgi:hypothetical protein